jgi:AGZA family xanthine/uracil permease-like MFS transporter
LLFFAPIAVSIPSYATAAVLFYVACMMMKPMADIAWQEPTEFIPAVITLLMIPLTYSISNGIGLGVICYLILNSAAGKWKNIHPALWVLGLVFLVYFLV